MRSETCVSSIDSTLCFFPKDIQIYHIIWILEDHHMTAETFAWAVHDLDGLFVFTECHPSHTLSLPLPSSFPIAVIYGNPEHHALKVIAKHTIKGKSWHYLCSETSNTPILEYSFKGAARIFSNCIIKQDIQCCNKERKNGKRLEPLVNFFIVSLLPT